MPKGYWVVSGDVIDPEGHKAYIAANAAAPTKYGARFLVRGGKSEVIEFKDFDTALPCYHSPEYAENKVLRNGKADLNIAVIEEYGRMAEPSDADILQPVFSTAGGRLWWTAYFRDGAIPA